MSEPVEQSYGITRPRLLSSLLRLARPDNPAEPGWRIAQRLYLAARTGLDGKTAVYGAGAFDEEAFARAYVERRYGEDGYVIPFAALYRRREL